MLLADLVAVSRAVAATSSRLEKVRRIAAALQAADTDEVGLVVRYLSGELRQRRTGVGYAAFRDLPAPAAKPTLGISQVDEAFERISRLSGPGSQARRQEALARLFAQATEEEQHFLARLALGELRQGALDGVMMDAVVKVSDAPAAEVRRAVMLAGAIPPVAAALLADGRQALERFRLEVGRPVRPMLAASAPDVAAALERLAARAGAAGERAAGKRTVPHEGSAADETMAAEESITADETTLSEGSVTDKEAVAGEETDRSAGAGLEWKLDGIRVQVHRRDQEIAIYTRTLDEVTERLPELVEVVADLPVRSVVLDGEVIALDGHNRPRPFQVTASRVGSRVDVERLRAEVPLRPFFFDILHLDGVDLLGAGGAERFEALRRVVPEHLRVPRLVTADREEAERFFADAVARGHEGILAKALDAPYEAGRRGSGWLKVKPRHTLDLVVLAAEWGHGRRTGLLSNLHLGARDPATGGFVMLGKTFKGLTDRMLRWQTERLLELAASAGTGGDLRAPRPGGVVRVPPELVVEIAFDGVQTSSRYPGGMALRFARVLRYRTDKRPEEADTVDAVRALHYGNGNK